MKETRHKARVKRKMRIRKKISGSSERPRLIVTRSLKHLYAQLKDDASGKTLVAVSTLAKGFPDKKNTGNCKGAAALGKILAERAKVQKIVSVAFDRNGFLYHGRVKALADAAREGGMKF